jgi:predicted Rossmann fold flavoprotein
MVEVLMEARGVDVLVVGGGAAGSVAAVVAARAGASVGVIERRERVGKKILATGNGRCNLSNLAIEGTQAAARYRNPAFVAPTLERYGCEAVRDFFNTLGLLTVADERGWVFPRTRSANSVLDVLVSQTRRLGIDVYTGHAARRLSVDEDGRLSVETEGLRLVSHAVVLACGVVPELGAIAHQQTIPPIPIVGPLKTDTEPLKGLDGVRVNCRVRLLDAGRPVAEESGELLFRAYGVSGIAVFNLSRFAAVGQEVSLDLLPELTTDGLEALLVERYRLLAEYHQPPASPAAAEFLDGMLHSRLALAVSRAIGLKPTDPLKEASLLRLAKLLKDYRLTVRGGPDEAQAQVTRGGLAVEGFDPATLESRTQPGLFAAGECLDVDGPCGGFNLHWAWASALVAGTQAAALATTQAAAAR